jgi:hypothetical protein
MVESKLSSAVSIHKRWICFLDWFRRWEIWRQASSLGYRLSGESAPLFCFL